MSKNARASELSSLTSPPRPLGMFLRTQLILGGAIGYFGWMWFSFSMIFWLVIGATPQLMTEIFAMTDSSASTEGVVVDWRDTNTEINDQTVERISFRYTIDGMAYEADVEVLESQARRLGDEYNMDIGRSVPVEYLVGKPHIARIPGAAWGVQSWFFVGFILLFLGIGLALAFANAKKGLKACHVLRHGKLAWGTYSHKEDSGGRINEEIVYRYFFSFKADDGKEYQVSHSTHKPDTILDEDQEPLLYDPDQPSQGVVIDGLPGGPRITGGGGFTSRSPILGIAALILPGIAALLVLASFSSVPW